MIDNKKDRYTEDGYNIKTVWNFIKAFAGSKHDDATKAPQRTTQYCNGLFHGKQQPHRCWPRTKGPSLVIASPVCLPWWISFFLN
jgi:hypothetical protein